LGRVRRAGHTTVAILLTITRDETMYQARLHPEQYSNTFSDEQVKRLHDAIMYVCDTAVGTLAESDKFPKDWLMKYRWDKGKKSGSQLPNGAKITFLTVGGRTSAIVPSVQKKTAAVAGDVSDGAGDEGSGEEEQIKPKIEGKRKAKDLEEDTASEAEAKPGRGRGRKTHVTEKNQDAETSAKTKRGRKTNGADIKEESGTEEDEEDEAPTTKKRKSAPAKKAKAAKGDAVKAEDTSGRRRSGRLAK
jgi:formamidopyrimidine-DNA glycosylase